MGTILLVESEKDLPTVLRKVLSPSEYYIIQTESHWDIISNKEREKGRGASLLSLEPLFRTFLEGAGDFPEKGDIYHLILSQLERPLFELTLKRTNGSQVRAAKILGISRATLKRKIDELGIEITKVVKSNRI